MYSNASRGKQRPAGFNREKLFLNLINSLPIDTPVTVFLDKKQDEVHFTETIKPYKKYEIFSKECGSEASSFVQLLNYIVEQNYSPNDIIVILEDDYKVIPGWHLLVEEGLNFGDYVSLYDHPDKYSNLYANLHSVIFKGRLSHWRTTPSTTNSYAMKVKTLMENFEFHLIYSQGQVTRDHEKFLALWRAGKKLVTCIPSAWSHEEIGMQSLENTTEKITEPVMTYFS
jgi:hypothetical protein